VFISINVERHLSQEQLDSLIRETLTFNTAKNKYAQYPGQRSMRNRISHLDHGIEIPDDIWSAINQL